MAGKLAAVVLIFFVGYVNQAYAGYKNDYSAWNETDKFGRYNYIMGLFDALQAGGFVGEQSYITALRTGLLECATKLHLRPDMLEEAMTRHYHDYPRDWGFPPSLIFQEVTKQICHDHINAARQKLELAPWKLSVGSISDSLK